MACHISIIIQEESTYVRRYMDEQTEKKALGFGDIKLFAAIGAWIGWPFLPLTLLISSVVGIMIYLIWRQQGKPVTQGIPFGTCLALGGWLSMMFGPQPLLRLYQYAG